MLNAKWYLLCNTAVMRAVDLLQIPNVWRNTTGMAMLDDSALATLNEWSSQKDEVFLSIEQARLSGIDGDSINAVLDVTFPSVQNWVRALRDPLLTESDKITMTDRWDKLDVVEKNDIQLYRQALRDVPAQDPFNVVWPAIPASLEYIRSLDLSIFPRPSDNFLQVFTEPAPFKTLEQIRNDQWLRIHDERERRTAGGVRVTVNGKHYWFWTDDKSRAQYALLDGRAQRMNLNPDFILDNWKTMSGEFIPLTVRLLHTVLDAGIVNESALFHIAETHRVNMLRSDDPLNYDYARGWPVIYEETVG